MFRYPYYRNAGKFPGDTCVVAKCQFLVQFVLIVPKFIGGVIIWNVFGNNNKILKRKWAKQDWKLGGYVLIKV